MTRSFTSDFHAHTATVLGALLILSVVAYGALILLMVQEAAYRVRAEGASTALTGELAALESEYLSLEESITLARAQASGFTEANTVARVARALPASALSLRHEPR